MQVQLRAMRKVGSDVINPCFKVDTAVSRLLDCGVRCWINCLRPVQVRQYGVGDKMYGCSRQLRRSLLLRKGGRLCKEGVV